MTRSTRRGALHTQTDKSWADEALVDAMESTDLMYGNPNIQNDPVRQEGGVTHAN